MIHHGRLRVALGGALAATAGVIAACGGASDAAPVTQQPPDRRAEMPAETQRDVHEVFHRLPQSCGRDRADKPTLKRTTARFIELYRRYPADRFRLTIDDESGSMLSALLVLRAEMAVCSPDDAASIDRVLPAQIRRGLPALRRESG
ncbi:MAG: hypothetical protein MSC31_11310 [Solirubrobacteraceae bacterium MAG38_C4-C5]|nr:hypothetical protein [Candidatus Siliceabacter maunaloa]